jgi:hypothetical protein
MFGFAIAGQIVMEVAISREVGESMALLAKGQKSSRGKTIQISFIVRYLALKNADQTRRVAAGQ